MFPDDDLGFFDYLHELYEAARESRGALVRLESFAEQGNSFAQWRMGALFDPEAPRENQPTTVRVNGAVAAYWYRKAAEQGLAAAQLSLALLYDRGTGVPRDRLQAARWLERAAEQGMEQAQWRLATLLLRNTGIPCNPEKALYWLRQAAAAGPARLQYGVGGIYEVGWRPWPDAQKPPFWAGRGTGRPPPHLGFPFSGLEIEPDPEEARRWYRMAAENGHAEAEYRMGLFLEEGIGGESDLAEAARWYRR
ncbi:tetratricopeptide repeat protein, partial [Methylacidimicrobium tartarophylax]